MTIESTRIAWGAAAVALAAAAGFGVARVTAPAPASPASSVAAPAVPQTLKIPAAYLSAADVQLETVTAGELTGEVRAAATVVSTPGAEAVATAGAAGTVTRLAKRLGDAVKAGETLALVASRDAAAIAADRTVAEARATQARRAAERERMLNAEGVSPRQDLEAAQTALAAAEAELRRARTAAATAGVSGDGRAARVVSPITGRITAESAPLGAFVQTDTAMFRIADPTKVQIEAQAGAADASRIKPGDPATVVTASGRFPASVRSVTPALAPGTQAATVVLDIGGTARLTPGEAAQALIRPKAGGPSGVLLVADDAVQRIDGREVVFVRTPDGFSVRPVTLGARSGGRASVLAGLKAGETVAAKNAFLLKAELGKGAEDEE